MLRVRAEPEAREGFLGEKPSDNMRARALQDRDVGACPVASAGIRSLASTDPRGSNDKIHPHALE